MRVLLYLILASLLSFSFAVAETLIVLKDNSVKIGTVIARTDNDIVLQTSQGEIVVIKMDEVSSITELAQGDKSSVIEAPKTEEGKYIKIPLFAVHEPSVRIGINTATMNYNVEDITSIYGDDKAFSIGVNVEFDYSPIVAFIIKYQMSSMQNSGIDSIGWITATTDTNNYDLKWAQHNIFMGPRFHYQFSLLNPYFEAGILYTTAGEKGSAIPSTTPPEEEEFSRGYGTFGFGYGFGIQLITPYSLTVFFEYSKTNAKKENVDLGNKFIGGGFQFIIPD